MAASNARRERRAWERLRRADQRVWELEEARDYALREGKRVELADIDQQLEWARSDRFIAECASQAARFRVEGALPVRRREVYA